MVHEVKKRRMLQRSNGKMRRHIQQAKLDEGVAAVAYDPEKERKRRKLATVAARKKFLKPSHQKAADLYLQGKTKKDALLAAGYSENYANKLPHYVFGRRDVMDYIAVRMLKLTARTVNIQERVQDELAKIAFFNIGKVLRVTDDGLLVYDFEDVDLDDLAAVGQVKVVEEQVGRVKKRTIHVKPYDKKAALDSLAKIHGMYQEAAPNTGESLEERLQRGRDRVSKEKIIDAEFEEV